MPIPDDAELDALISHLAGPLSPSDRETFRLAAQAALACVSCWGEGAVYRTVAALQREYFAPLDDRRTAWDISQELPRSSKLAAAAPIGADDPRTGARDRRRLKLVG
jgi:hypothetical protein